MRVTQVAELTQGDLINKPSISEFTHLALNLGTVKRGSLFFAIHPEQVSQALECGAYGVIYEGEMEILDEEIAWIRVKSMNECIARLTRYLILRNRIEVFYLKRIEFEIFKQICQDKSVILHENDKITLLNQLSQKENTRSIITTNEDFLQKAVELNKTVVPKEKPLSIHVATLFDMHIYQKLSHYHLNLPPLFFDQLCAVVYLCKTHNMQIDLSKFQGIEYISPIFIDKIPRLIAYGQSERVLIAQKQLDLFKEYTRYIAKNGKWGRISLFIPKDCDHEFEYPHHFYSSHEELIELFRECDFNFGMVLGVDIPTLQKILTAPTHQSSLFS